MVFIKKLEKTVLMKIKTRVKKWTRVKKATRVPPNGMCGYLFYILCY